jgi:hypothetical protein
VSERAQTLRAAAITFFPMFIATLSLVTSIYNGHLNARFVDIIQNNVGRVEYMRSCKDLIDIYFQAKYRAGILQQAGASLPGATLTSAQVEGGLAVAKFGALGTYLANLRDDETRARYTAVTQKLEWVMVSAPTQSAASLAKEIGQLDRLFTPMNDDCVMFAKDARP